MRTRWALVVILASLACGTDAPSHGSDTSGSSSGSTSTSESGVDSSSTGDDHGDRIPLPTNRDAAILFVVDDSVTMGAAQGRLARGAAAFWGPLSNAGANFRVAFTTTDNGNPTCDAGTVDAGAFVMSSCLSRLGDFSVDMENASAQACMDVCTLPTLDLQPTVTGRDPTPTVRPWLEGGGGSNLVDASTFADAFACAAPQGIAGCGFESILESMHLALARTTSASDPAYGFVEEAAVLAVVFVSDETDCSNDPAWSSIFLSEADGGDPSVFWSDPMASAPTSAVCWNAGVVCTGGPSVYDECHSVNNDVAGNGGAADDEAVLYPLSRYVDELQAIEDAKQTLAPDQQVIVASIAGVPAGYESGASEIMWAPAEDAGQQDEYGIGAGCLDALGGFAVPPVREREVTEAFETTSMRSVFSICAGDYDASLGEIASRIVDQLSLACAPMCVADTDPGPIGVQPSCTVVQEAPGQPDLEIPPCNGDDLPNGVDVCWIARVDFSEDTERLWDDMSPMCVAAGWNLEIDIHRAVPLPAGGTITFACEPSPNPAIDCPNLP